MRKKRWAAALAAALCVLMLAGCKGKPLPDGMEEDAVLAAGEAGALWIEDPTDSPPARQSCSS